MRMSARKMLQIKMEQIHFFKNMSSKGIMNRGGIAVRRLRALRGKIFSSENNNGAGSPRIAAAARERLGAALEPRL